MSSLLITGGSGSFGHAFLRHALTGPWDRIAILSRDELKQSLMRPLFPDPRVRWFLGDVRDRDRLRRAFEGVDTVVHAAALKQVDTLEYNPHEAVKTNIQGAVNVTEAALDAGVRRVVALSTDKACGPLNVYGASKLVAEKVILGANAYAGLGGARFACTRYGNVAGSRGSVIPRWREALATGQPLVLTCPEMTRFWMTLEEAVALVQWTLDHMTGGELVVPDLPAYALGDLLLAVGGGVCGKVTGLRPGEKMHEAMISADEAPAFTRVDGYYVAGGHHGGARLSHAVTSDRAARLAVEDLQGRLACL